MKVGDIVKLADGSGNLCLLNGQLQHICDLSLRNQRYKILAVGGRFPSPDDRPDRPDNDMMMVDTHDCGRVVFTQERFCNVTESNPPRPLHTVTIPRGTRCVELMLE